MYVMIVIVFCFFKQKTAYEMRISDWSSDVCSADLLHILFRDVEAGAGVVDIVEDRRPRDEAGDQAVAVARIGFVAGIVTRKADEDGRSAERRGGKECVSTGRSRGSAYHLKNNEK